jgi:penicillin amidase
MTPTSQHTISGLSAEAEIVVDRWGIPHIRAQSRMDVFLAQGFNAARDRLWQLDVWRKRGLGELAADFGPGFLAQDRAARLFLYRGDMTAEWAAYGVPDAEAICTAFVAGINAYVGLTESGDVTLPAEFAATGTQPARWAAADVVRIRSNALVRNVLSEVARARVAAKAGFEADLARRSLEPFKAPHLADGLSLADIPAEVLTVFRLATNRFDLSPDRLAAGIDDAGRWTGVSDLGDVYLEGSNNWAVAPSRTATGRAILASDPHRAHALPSLRYIVHLTAPGIDAIGVGEPATPGMTMGHNEAAAFSLTIFPMDQEDLYVYELDPADPDRYRYGAGWERMRVVREMVAVRGAGTQEVTLRFTRHGPVLHADQRHAFAVRSVWFDPGASAYMSSLAYLSAKTPEEYDRALMSWRTPSANHVYADVAGNIAWWVAGAAPVRPNWDGLLPVPGDGRYEWRGIVPPESLPRSVNPARGFIATANEMNIPPTWRWEDAQLGYEWAEHSRTGRIHEVLRSQARHSLAQSMALQTDTLSIPARRLGALLAGLAGDLGGDGDLRLGLEMLLRWDHRLTRESPAAALQEVWWSKHLKQRLLDRLAPDPEVRALLVPGDLETLVGLLEQPDVRLPDRDALLRETLAAAVAECRERMGEPSKWAWGRLHHGYFPHPLGRVADGLPDVGPLAKGGSGSTPMAAGYRLSDFRITSGASFRMVCDVGNWDASVCINAPGQSGDPGSPHYGDLAPIWAAGEYVPMLFSRAAVDAAAERIIRLLPA